MCRQILLFSITSDVFKKHRSPRVLAKHPKKISAIDWYYSPILIRRRCNRFRIIQFGLAGALEAVKSPFEPSNRSSEFSSKLYGQFFLPRGSVVYPRDRCLLLLRIKRNPTGFSDSWMRYETTLSPGNSKRSFLLFRRNDRHNDAPSSNFFSQDCEYEKIHRFLLLSLASVLSSRSVIVFQGLHNEYLIVNLKDRSLWQWFGKIQGCLI